MIYKIRKKLWDIRYTIDELGFIDDVLTIRGWIFSPENKIENLHLLISDKNQQFKTKIKYGIKRNDVYQTFRFDNSKKCGFYGQFIIENIAQFRVYLCYVNHGKKYKFCIGKFNGVSRKEKDLPPRVRFLETGTGEVDLEKLLDEQQEYQYQFPEDFYADIVDIIVPVFNGYSFLGKLLESINATKMKYRLILIDDKSTDPRVPQLLEDYAKGKENVILLKNSENLGFLKTVNKGFEYSKNNVALVNTDVELPYLWLERLMYPIMKDPKIASSTPFTNCGNICSFPNFSQDNTLFLDLEVQQIDDEFIKIIPKYESIPTGVGFCMGINHNVLTLIGEFDAASFGKGYGEENDWCQRAIDHGFRNVHVENLFVYHKHGGSFLSEDKKRYLKEHEKILLKKHPYYNRDVANFCRLDPNKEIREFVKLNLLKKYGKYRTILAFDHALGGGATKYLIEKKNEKIQDDQAFVIVRFDFVKERYVILYYYQTYKMSFHVKEISGIMRMMDFIHVDEIWINELVTYPDIYRMLRELNTFKKKKDIYIKMLFHDFFAVCPTINLLNDKECYCHIPEGNVCSLCLNKAKNLQSLEYESIQKWRSEWGAFLNNCDEIVTFSNDSKEIVEKAFGKFEKVIIQPHQIPYIPVIKKKYKTTETLNIGLLGTLTKHKGRLIVKELVDIIEKEHLNIKVKLIGNSSKKINSPVFKETGHYSRESIPRLILENDIDIFLIPSIWPETFSYTTEEIMQMKMPIMCFDIGAPAERVSKYEYGIIIPDISAKAIVEVIQKKELVKQYLRYKKKNKEILFIVEDVTFSSRYRVDHLREQLLHQGVKSECVSIDEINNIDVRNYNNFVIYRSTKVELVQRIVKKVHKCGKKVFYDIDDYIFNYPAISDLKFLEGSDYEGFDKYSRNIRKSMELCDGYIVSTLNLKKAVEEEFPKKVSFVNRNVASMEMVILSLNCRKRKNKDIIKLGYFSGSKTHNEDFERIEEEILYIMEKNPNISLLIGGQIELSSKFSCVKERIEKFEFVSWEKLPRLIAKADINLMPLEETFFHACKSENKWMEAALVGIPTIATWNEELEGVIENGVTGYLCKRIEEWRVVLQSIIDDSKLRSQIGQAAQRKVLENYNTWKIEPEILELLINETYKE